MIPEAARFEGEESKQRPSNFLPSLLFNLRLDYDGFQSSRIEQETDIRSSYSPNRQHEGQNQEMERGGYMAMGHSRRRRLRHLPGAL
jgi:hypothetical protein